MTYIDSEIKELKQVIVHYPDSGIGRVTPKKAETLLFDDIVYLPKMREEHRIFTSILEAFLGKENVFETEDLLTAALVNDPELRRELVERIIDFEELPVKFVDHLLEMGDDNLSHVLITGYLEEEDTILFDPIPNFIFTRDIAVVVKDHVIITKAAKSARFRENYLTRFIFRAHPMFVNVVNNDRLININDIETFPPNKRGEAVSIEGGDMMMIDEDYLLIGCSERTTHHAFESLKDVLFRKKLIKYMVLVEIPDDRSFMHIDTLFTRIDHDLLACFKPIVYDGLGSTVKVYGIDGTLNEYHSVKEFFQGEINPDMKFVFTGGGKFPYQEREQWTDGCNLVALKPGIAITYDRNKVTSEDFMDKGYQIMTALDFLFEYSQDNSFAQKLTKTIITIPSSELSRGRGGTHCMTCPIVRR